ncbi:MAG: xisI [bacterium]|nr:MAG: xisI [bacterium]
MDKLEKYRKILQDIILRYARHKPSNGEIEPISIFDTIHDQYLLMDVGWSKPGRVHDIVIHLQLKDGKVWVEWDGIETGITQEMLDAGIPKEDIVLAFYTPEHRKLTDFAVA